MCFFFKSYLKNITSISNLNLNSERFLVKDISICYILGLLNNIIMEKKWVMGHCNRAAVSRNRYGVEKT